MGATLNPVAAAPTLREAIALLAARGTPVTLTLVVKNDEGWSPYYRAVVLAAHEDHFAVAPRVNAGFGGSPETFDAANPNLVRYQAVASIEPQAAYDGSKPLIMHDKDAAVAATKEGA